MKRFFKKLSAVIAAAVSMSCVPFTSFSMGETAYAVSYDNAYYFDKDNIVLTKSPSKYDEIIIYKNGEALDVESKDYVLSLDVKNNAVITKSNLNLPENYELQYGTFLWWRDDIADSWYIKAENEDDLVQLAKMSQQWVNNGIIENASAYRTIFCSHCCSVYLSITLDSADENFLNRLDEIQKSVGKPEHECNINSEFKKLSDTEYEVYSDALTVMKMKEVLESEENVKEVLTHYYACDLGWFLVDCQTASEFVGNNDDVPVVTSPPVTIWCGDAPDLTYDRSPMKVGEERIVKAKSKMSSNLDELVFSDVPSNIKIDYTPGEDSFKIIALAQGEVNMWVKEKRYWESALVCLTVEDETSVSTSVSSTNEPNVSYTTTTIPTETRPTEEPIFWDYNAVVEFDDSPMKVGEKRKVRVYNPETQNTVGITFPAELPSEISIEYEEGSDTFYITALATGKVSLEVWEKSCPFTNRLNFTIEEGTEPDVTTETKIKVPEGVEASVLGDSNKDEAINVADIVKLNLFLLNQEENPLTDVQIANSDCLKDGYIDAKDSSTIMNYVSMNINSDALNTFSGK